MLRVSDTQRIQQRLFSIIFQLKRQMWFACFIQVLTSMNIAAKNNCGREAVLSIRLYVAYSPTT
jgi:hypothetical protein